MSNNYLYANPSGQVYYSPSLLSPQEFVPLSNKPFYNSDDGQGVVAPPFAQQGIADDISSRGYDYFGNNGWMKPISGMVEPKQTPLVNPNSLIPSQYMFEQGNQSSSEDSLAPMRAFEAFKSQQGTPQSMTPSAALASGGK